ncbi:Aste57867_15627 [Aphanomyces stellatus]|uniref:Aste57867_15627 protein n=1 Tax=Aphanomyces stellatus TaxID=120398 RepID=A0A485L452_9STRA|nr:hypothetical protein As57867_015571 [Aphanomyces stellatus]VFT92424.1 Aste57867_15627 [Aphanomyces stellatus]
MVQVATLFPFTDSTTPLVYTIALALFVIGILVTSVLVFVFVLKPSWSPLTAIPGPKSSHWFFGSLKDVFDIKWSHGQFPEPFLSWIKVYGGAVHYRAITTEIVLLTDPEALKHVFTTHSDNYPRSEETRAFLRDIIGGDGLLSTEGETHKRQRKMLMPHFGFAKIKDFVHVFARHAARLDDALGVTVDTHTPVDMHEYFTKLTLDIIGVSAFGYDFGAQTGGSLVEDAVKLLLSAPSLLVVVGITFIPTFRQWPLPRLTRRRQAKRMLYEAVDDVITAKLAAPRDVSRAVDLVDLMLDELAQTDHRVTAEEARTHVMTFMLAGHETTSATLDWILTFLAQHPDIEAKARDEARAAASSSDGTIGCSALADLKYITACILETLRLYPTVAQLASRMTGTDDYIPMSIGKPIFVPKGTVINVHTGALHRNPQYWVQPDAFVPERFLDGSVEFAADKALRNGQGNTYFYMPFSTGPKNCIGMRFAMAELQVVVATLLLKHSFRLTSEADIHPKLVGVTIKPVKLDMTVHSVA